MAHLLIFIHNSGIWKGTIQSWLKNSIHFSCYQSLSRGYNVQISKCLTLTWEISNIKCRCYHVANFSTMASALYRENSTCISSQEVKLQVKLPVEKKKHPQTVDRVRTLFWTKTSRTFQGLSRTHFAFFKDSIQCKKEIWVYVFFSSTTTWAILSWRSFILGTWEFGLDKVSTEIQGLSSTDCNFQGLSRPWTFYFKFQGLSRSFKVRANPV